MFGFRKVGWDLDRRNAFITRHRLEPSGGKGRIEWILRGAYPFVHMVEVYGVGMAGFMKEVWVNEEILERITSDAA